MKNTCILILLFLSHQASSQGIDSLLQVIQSTKNDSVKVSAINQAAFYYIFNNSEKALEMIYEGKKLAANNNLRFGFTELLNTHGIYFNVLYNQDSAHYYFIKALKASRENKWPLLEEKSLNNMGMSYWNNGNFNTALDYFFQALKLNDTNLPPNPVNRAKYYNNIGLIYQELKQFGQALEYHRQALSIREQFDRLNDQAISLSNIGVCYKNLKQYEEAVRYYKQAIQLARKVNNVRMFHSLHDNLGNVFLDKGDYTNAQANFLIALNAPEHLGRNPKSQLSVLSNLTVASVHLNEPKKALDYATQALTILDNNPELENFANTLLKATAQSHYLLGNVNKGHYFLDRYTASKDSMFSYNHAKAIATLRVTYETEKKEQQIAILSQENTIQQLSLQQQNMYLLTAGLLLVITLGAGVAFYRNRKQKEARLLQEAELKAAWMKVQSQQELHQDRLRIARELHDNIGSHLTFINSAVSYIPEAGLHRDKKIKQVKDLAITTLRELRKTVWLINKPAVDAEEFAMKLREYFKDQFPVEVCYTVAHPAELSTTIATQLFRVVQEAVNNALKHAQAKNITITIGELSGKLTLCVTDNGVGFSIEAMPSGYGISSMKSRMESINGSLCVTSAPAAGTSVHLQSPFQ